MDKVIKFILCVGICLSTGFVGSLFTTPQINSWYVMLEKPFFNPPNYIFGPVWTILYVMMGISLYLVFTSKAKKKIKIYAVRLFLLQLVLNLGWSIIFFSFKNPLLAFIEIMALWVVIAATIRAFLPISKNAGYLLFPYIAWVTFAAVLNFAIVLLS